MLPYQIIGKSGYVYIGYVNFNLNQLYRETKSPAVNDPVPVQKCIVVHPIADKDTTVGMHLSRNPSKLFEAYEKLDDQLKTTRMVPSGSIDSFVQLPTAPPPKDP